MSTTPVVLSGKISLPIQSTMKAENSHKAAKWNESHHNVVHEVVPGTSQPKIQVSRSKLVLTGEKKILCKILT